MNAALMPADRFEAARLQKLEKLAELGIDPFGQRFDGHLPIAEARDRCPAEGGVDGERVRVAGRIIRWPKTGKLQFLHIQDASGRIQLMVSQRDVSESVWQILENLDLGDLVGVDGLLRRTRTGEISIFVEGLTILGKSLTQPPEKFHGVHDVELLLRQRYIDMIYNEGVLDRLLLRSEILASIRRTLHQRRFVEVETPVLHAIAGGAAARPFTTHHNALDISLYLRIALELHLKRLMVGGIERVYEIGRVFRNEGIDATHNPEFTMIEIYQAYGNYETMMDLTEAIVCDAARVVAGQIRSRRAAMAEGEAAGDPAGDPSAAAPPAVPELALPWGDGHIDFTPPWPRRTYADLFREHAGCDMGDAAAVQAKAREQAAHGAIKPDFIQRMEAGSVHPDVVVSEVFEACVEHHLTGPVFVIDYPASICPLTKRKAGAPQVAERFELFINGMELANAYTELNDPYLQEELFRTQLAGQAEEDSMAKMDHEFIHALKVGMPAAGGLGIGVDRLVMLLTNTRSIRDVIFFPLLRPET